MEYIEHKTIGNNHIYNSDTINVYDKWPSPMMIMCDGPYGVGGYKGDLLTSDGLAEWYEPHIKIWSEKATPQTTLWFWNTELGWATVHPMLLKYGWEFKSCHIWDKGLSHVAGNVNTQTLSKLPVVTEVCVQYIKRPYFMFEDKQVTMKEWLRLEWQRSGLPFRLANQACGVVDAATRKYFTTDNHLWYMPPADVFAKMVSFINEHGKEEGRPYYSVNGKTPLTKDEWETYKPKFHCPFGVTNVWSVPQLRNAERLKLGNKSIHLNQKPLVLISRLIEMCTDENDVVWDPFAGLCTTAVASHLLHRKCYSAEITKEVYEHAIKRVEKELAEQRFEF